MEHTAKPRTLQRIIYRIAPCNTFECRWQSQQ
ncbi:Uncharacterised protein [Klebsiella pneumoniae]|nr:Uncharacterised protein [Klebsiella pneumoniae]